METANPYLTALRSKYAAIDSTVRAMQTRAVEENRDLTEEETRSIASQVEAGEKLYKEIELLTEQENRSAAVAGMAAKIAGDAAANAPQSRGLGAKTQARDPGHYRSAEDGGQRSFFSDLARVSVLQDDEAKARLDEHAKYMRAQTTAGIAGVVPPKWLSDLYTEMAQQGRALADAVANYTITDARPFSLPGQTATTTVANQAAENDPIVAGDDYDAATVTVTPTTVVGKEAVSRQLVDASTPAIDQILLADLTRAYNAEIERRLGVAIRAVGTPLTTELAGFQDIAGADFGHDLAINAGMAVRKGLKNLRPTFFALDIDLFGEYLKLKDADGRPVVVSSQVAVNSIGEAGLTDDGRIAGIRNVVSDGMEPPSPNEANMAGAMVHGPSVILFESPGMRFKYEEQMGPETIVMGIWRYAAIAVRNGSLAVKNILVTPDTP